MRRVVPAVFVLAAAGVAAAAPVPKEARVKFVNMEGTTWEGDGVVAPTVYRFEKGGRVVLTYNKTGRPAGTWRQEGAKVYWEVNNKYCEYEGTLKGDTLTTRAWNVKGKSWDLTIKRAAEPAAAAPATGK